MASEVPIHVKTGCGICGSTERHTHPYDEWKAALDATAKQREADRPITPFTTGDEERS